MITRKAQEILGKIRCFLGREDGSVAMEYIVLVTMCVFSYECWLQLFEPGVGFTEYGRQFTAFFQRILVGISLPVP